MACLGILTYTFASLVSRLQRFTILRAIGLRLVQLWAIVTVEYLGVVIYGILVGTAAGVIASVLFVPYFRLTSSLASNVPPFIPEIAWSRIFWMVLVYMVVLSLAEIIVLLRVTRRQAFQALRLLTDQE